MNWTGGSLQRHSKSNLNSVVKKQKEHFAKARLKARTQQAQHLQCTSSRPASIGPLSAHSHYLGSGDLSHRISENRPASGIAASALGSRNRGEISPTHLNDTDHQPLRGGNQSSALNGVDYARKDLLDKTDWVGLAATRPLGLRHISGKEMGKLGRRRKTSPSGNLAAKARHRQINPANLGASLHTEEISIRVGSNIHQTQPTPSAAALKASTQRSNIDLSDAAELSQSANKPLTQPSAAKVSRKRKRDAAIDDRLPGDRGFAEDDASHLVPLEEAVEYSLKSWDEVRQHSARSRSDTSHSAIVHRSTAALQSLHDDGLQSSVESDPFSGQHQSNPKLPRTTGNTTLARPLEGTENHNSSLLRQRGIAIRSSSFAITTPSIFEDVANPQDEQFPVYEANDLDGLPRYTLEDQVVLEQTANTTQIDGPDMLYNSTWNGPLPAFLPNREMCQSDGLQGLPAWHTSRHQALPRHSRSSRRVEDGTANGGIDVTQQVTGDNMDWQQPGVCSHQTSSNGFEIGKPAVSQFDTAMDNDAWMKFVFPDGIQHSPTNFVAQVNALHPRYASQQQIKRPAMNGPSSEQLERPSPQFKFGPPALATDASSRSFPSAHNTTIFVPASQNVEQSETDFLSNLSPMEGLLDDRLVDLSTYYNSNHTERLGWSRSMTSKQLLTVSTHGSSRAHMPRPLQFSNTKGLLLQEPKMSTSGVLEHKSGMTGPAANNGLSMFGETDVAIMGSNDSNSGLPASHYRTPDLRFQYDNHNGRPTVQNLGHNGANDEAKKSFLSPLQDISNSSIFIPSNMPSLGISNFQAHGLHQPRLSLYRQPPEPLLSWS